MGSPWSLKQNPSFQFENPFILKVGQIFTGFGVGCGVGIGVGNPFYFGAIPALQQIMVATRGATDIFSGVGRQVNTSMKKLGLKNVQAGVGCGIGIGHGFGVGFSLKPGVINGVQSSLEGLVSNLMTKMKDMPGFSSPQDATQKATQDSATPSNESSSIVNNKIISGETSVKESTGAFSESTGSTRTEKVLSSFLQNPLIRNDAGSDFGETPKNSKAMNNVLHMILKHQQTIDELREENAKLREILIEDLKVSPSKFQLSTRKNKEHPYAYEPPCYDCFECRRKSRKIRK
ncbi:hypothetical protein LUZ60_014375 [Juncus effusus]|nr:hypothetical protein LUZ60_014375 [Juncus effusus]